LIIEKKVLDKRKAVCYIEKSGVEPPQPTLNQFHLL